MNHSKDGYHFNSTYWQQKKLLLPPLSPELLEIAFGIVLGDATIRKVSRHAVIKFEQGYRQKEFVESLFQTFHTYTFMEQPGIRFDHSTGALKSFWFRTFSFPCFTKLFESFYTFQSGKYRKRIHEETLYKMLTPRAFAYWVICDGSLQKDARTLILHSQAFSQEENMKAQKVLNEKFGFQSRVIPHKTHYFVICIPAQDASLVRALLTPFVLPSFQ